MLLNSSEEPPFKTQFFTGGTKEMVYPIVLPDRKKLHENNYKIDRKSIGQYSSMIDTHCHSETNTWPKPLDSLFIDARYTCYCGTRIETTDIMFLNRYFDCIYISSESILKQFIIVFYTYSNIAFDIKFSTM